MSYIDEIITEGEKLIYRAKIHWIVFWTPAVYFMMFLFFLNDGMGVLIRFLGLKGLNKNLGFSKIVHDIELSSGLPSHVIVAYTFLALTVIYLYLRLIKFLTTEVAMTNERIIVKVGLFRIDSAEILLDKVESILIQQSALGRMLKYGSLAFVGGSLGGSTIRWVADPRSFHKAVQLQITEDGAGAAEKKPVPKADNAGPDTDV